MRGNKREGEKERTGKEERERNPSHHLTIKHLLKNYSDFLLPTAACRQTAVNMTSPSCAHKEMPRLKDI